MNIGIIGGGQLASMLIEADRQQNHSFFILDPEPECPAVISGGIHVQGNPVTGEGFQALADQVSVITLELEHVSIDELANLSANGMDIFPKVDLLARVTDKHLQKKWLQELGLPTAAFVAYDGMSPIDESPFGFPVVQKAARGGYDGRGVAVLNSVNDYEGRLQVDGYLEQYIERRMEISVIVVASRDGNTRAFDPVEMLFRSSGNVLDYLIAPARAEANIQQQAKDLALKIVQAMQGIGVFGVELFLTHNNDLLINEISPRTHNSGHYKREACENSQFDQQLRILTNQPLAELEQQSPAVMFNLLGENNFEGDALLEDNCTGAEKESVSISLYNKKHCFPGRKMGHVTVLGKTIDEALDRAAFVKSKIIVRGANQIED